MPNATLLIKTIIKKDKTKTKDKTLIKGKTKTKDKTCKTSALNVVNNDMLVVVVVAANAKPTVVVF